MASIKLIKLNVCPGFKWYGFSLVIVC